MWYHKDSNVYTFSPQQDIDMLNRVRELSESIQHDNYHSLPWEEFDAVSVYLREEQIMGFSSIWHRPQYYESGEVRILNRYWESPNLRRISKIIGGDHLIQMVNQQLKHAIDTGHKKCFISRERSPKYFTHLINNIAQGTNTVWTIEPDKVPVCNPQAESCWQYKGTTVLC